MERFCVSSVRAILGIALLFLAIVSAVSTCTVYGGAEMVEYYPDWPPVHLAVLAAALCAGVRPACGCGLRGRLQAGERQGRRRLSAWQKQQTKHRRTVSRRAAWLFGPAAFYLLWILVSLVWGGSDSRYCLASAECLLRGDLSPWKAFPFQYGSPDAPAGYAYTYPSQNGLILYMVPFAFLFGDAAPYVMQACNVGFFFLGVSSVCRMMRRGWDGRPDGAFRSWRFSAPGMLWFLPFGFYVLFVYGTMPGFGLSCLAMERAQRYAAGDAGAGTRADGGSGAGRLPDLAAAVLFAAVACLLKSNYLIVLVGIVIYLAVCAFARRRPALLAAAALAAAVTVAGSRGVTFLLSEAAGQPAEGIPMTAWAEMGLQEGSRGPGWYNGYHVGVFLEQGGDAARTRAAVAEDLRKTLAGMAADPAKTADFFLRKTQSIWAEPTFQSLWIQEVGGKSAFLAALSPSLLKEGGVLNFCYLAAANLVQTLVFAGAFLWLALGGREITWERLLPGMVFLGGFLFHLVWEAKGQYTVCYFVLLIPYACAGIRAGRRAVRAALEKREEGKAVCVKEEKSACA